ncbi:MAG: cell division protein FtsZ [Oscillospiraceae bacterium]|nr:cell division protein FtsZ [Oscillospiraceae bacterium]
MAIFYDEDGFAEELGDELDTNSVYDVNIKVFGIGGGGCNALEHMAKNGVPGVEYIAVNTDVPALRSKDKTLMKRLQIGKKTTKGRGAGGDPGIAAESAHEDREEIEKVLKGASMVFISAGMGGGTGTGAAPVIADIAREQGILTVGIVTKPFDFEREHKMNLALKGIAEMRKVVDALVIIPNQKLLKLNERALNFRQAFAMVDDVLYNVVRSISELLNNTAVMNIDFADLRSTLENAGDAHIAIGVGTGDNKVDEAVQKIVNSPLLETSIANAGKVLVNVVMSEDTLLYEVDEVMNKITGVAHPDVKVIYGADYSPALKDEMVVTIIATCFGVNEGAQTASEVRAAVEEAKAAKGMGSSAVSNAFTIELDDEDEIQTTNLKSLDRFITENLSEPFEDDPFKDLDEIFKKR